MTAGPPFILTLDIGTSSTRAMLFDCQAKAVPGCLAQVAYRLRTSPVGAAEFDPPELFAAVVEVIDQLLRQAGSQARQIDGVAIDTLVTNIMGVDASGQPTTPSYTFADTRNAADAQQLREQLGTRGVQQTHNRTGCFVHSAYLPARFQWLARTRPELLTATTRWVSIGEYVLWRLLGHWRVSFSVAAWTGLLNRHQLVWDPDWLSALPIAADQLSPLADVDQPLVGLKDEWAARWPTLKEVPWFPAIGDGAAANIGSGCGSPERLALTIGTTGAMRVVLPAEVASVPAGLWLYWVDRRRALLGGATTEGGNLFAWLSETLHLPSPAEVELELQEMAPVSHGLTVLPFLAGERAPGWHDDAKASLIGLTINTRPIDILRAALESVAYRFALIYRLIGPHLPQETEHQVIASGGGLLSSPAWLQIMADVLGRPILTLAEKETTSRGVALLALESLGTIEDTTSLPPSIGPSYQPNQLHHEQYQTAMGTQLEYYQLLIERDSRLGRRGAGERG
jgi:gluconokinase